MEKGQLFISNYKGAFRVRNINCNSKHSHRVLEAQASNSSDVTCVLSTQIRVLGVGYYRGSWEEGGNAHTEAKYV